MFSGGSVNKYGLRKYFGHNFSIYFEFFWKIRDPSRNVRFSTLRSGMGIVALIPRDTYMFFGPKNAIRSVVIVKKPKNQFSATVLGWYAVSVDHVVGPHVIVFPTQLS